MFDQLLEVLSVESVEHVEEVVAIWNSILCHLCRKESHELLVLLQHWPDLDHSQLIVERHTDSLDLIESKQFFVVSEDFFEEIFVEHILGRQIQLH